MATKKAGPSIYDWIANPQSVGHPSDNGLGAALAQAAYSRAVAGAQQPDQTYDTTTYDSGGGGGDATYLDYTPPPAPKLADSPEWLAFLNELGLNEGQYRTDIQKREGLANQQAQGQIGDVGFQGDQSRRQITGGLEQRGMARSGQLVRALAQQRAGEGRQTANIQTGLANTMSGLESELMNKLIDLNTQRQQQELNLRSQGWT